MTQVLKARDKILILGLYQIIGGLIGIGLSILLLVRVLNQGPNNGETVFMLMLISMPFLLSLYAGYSCIKNHSNKFLISKVNQAFQVASFSIAGTAYTYYSGAHFSIGIDTTLNSIFDFKLGLSSFNLEFNSGSDNYVVYVNLIAFYLLFKIMKYEELMDEVSEKYVGNQSYLDDEFITNQQKNKNV
jgi:hypothetical protein